MTTQKNTYFEKDELEELLKNLQNLRQKPEYSNYSNEYELFIEQCRNKTYPSKGCLTVNVPIEKHHIIPKHQGGNNDPSNLILLSVKDHITAHWLLWKLFDSKPDKLAYIFRVSTPAERQEIQREANAAYIEKCRQQGIGRFDPQLQSERGKKGGQKGGLAGTVAQFEARQKVGKTFGPQVGIRRQSPKLIAFLANYSIWEFKGCKTGDGVYHSKGKKAKKQICPPGMTEENFYVLVGPKETFKLMMETLELFAPGSIAMDSVSSMHKLISTALEKKRIYGWSLFKTLTRSAVEAGELDTLPIDFFIESIVPE
jgi:hypothetical protein